MNPKHRIRKIKERVPVQLDKKNLQVNKTKTEEYTIKGDGQTDWKRCKYLGSLLDTEEHIKKSFSSSNLQQTEKNILKNKSTSMKTKIRIENIKYSLEHYRQKRESPLVGFKPDASHLLDEHPTTRPQRIPVLPITYPSDLLCSH